MKQSFLILVTKVKKGEKNADRSKTVAENDEADGH
jgi:hypothetical protein